LTVNGAPVATDDRQAMRGRTIAGLSGSFGASRVPFASVE